MTKVVTTAASGLAKRTSRRGFLGKSGHFLLALVGGSALMALMAGTAQAAEQRTNLFCTCSNPCYHWSTCCATKVRKHYECPVCGPNHTCEYTICTQLAC